AVTRYPEQPDHSFIPEPDPARLARHHGRQGDEAAVDIFLTLFLQGDVAAETRARLVSYLRDARRQRPSLYDVDDDPAARPLRAACHLVLTLPEFQLN